MMTRDDAKKLVDGYLVQLQTGRAYELRVLDELTREEDFGWVFFFYNSRRFVETRDIQWALGGNAPLIVDKYTGELHVTGTSHPVEHYIERYRRGRVASR